MTDENRTRLGKEIQTETGKILRRGRKSKRLSLAEAARRLDMSPFYLKALEEGSTHQPLCDVYRIAEFYGHCLPELWALTCLLMDAKAMREWKTLRRTHLSVVADNPKPWAQLPASLAALRGRTP